MDNHLQAIEQVRSLAIDMGMKFGPKVLVATAMLIAGYICGRWVGGIMARALHRLHLEPPILMLLVRTVRVLVFGLFAIIALQNLGIELLPLIAGLGVAGAGVALALQGVLGNAAAGLTIIFTRPFRVGDYISIVKEEGEVLEISIFNTVLGHADLSRIVIPNRKIAGEILHNYGRIRQLGLEVRVPSGTKVGDALAAIDAILAANPRVLRDPKPVTGVSSLLDSSISIAICPWVNVPDFGDAIDEIHRAILEEFRARNIAIAVPAREIRMAPALERASAG